VTERRWAPLSFLLLVMACSRTPPPPKAAASPSPSPGEPPPIDRHTPLPNPLPRVAARVNGQPVPSSNVKFVAQLDLYPVGSLPPEEKPFAYRRALRQFIVRELLFQEAMARNLAADERAIEQAYNEARVKYKDDKDWEAHLSGQGMDPQNFRTELRIDHTVRALLQAEAQQIPQPTDEDAKAFFDTHPLVFKSGERVHARQIFLQVIPGSIEASRNRTRTRALIVLRGLRGGHDFATVARSVSQDDKTAQKGGDLGVLMQGQMSKAFDDAAWALKPGEISDVVEVPGGFDIIKLEERLPELTLAFDQAKARVKVVLFKKQEQEHLQNLVNSLRAKAKIETFL
jgi:peptidyl-prolyl cis-trans isomerase C